MKLKFIKPTIFAVIALMISSCSSDDDATVVTSTIDKTAVKANYVEVVFASYQSAMTDAQTLKTAINNFTATPTDANFTIAKDAWKEARESYGVTEAFRFSDGPIDSDSGPEGLLNAWPLEEQYIDYVDGAATAGIVNDLTKTISKAELTTLNNGPGEPGSDPEKNVAVGYHAIEFLLWGQDLTAPSAMLAGQRPYTDFVDAGTAQNQDRRREYLNICADLLIDHLQLMIDEWQVGGSYRTTFIALNNDVALKNMLKGIASLSKSELAVERMSVALVNQDQEDEHSCFSDNTHRDVRLNLEGIANVYRGHFNTVDGTSLEDIITQTNATLGAEITAQLAAAESLMEATAVPFDFAISDATERPKVQATIVALQTLGDKFVEGGAALGISVNVE